jgi:hypothetical protein
MKTAALFCVLSLTVSHAWDAEARYVRLYGNGNTENDLNHWCLEFGISNLRAWRADATD